jgi:hypothetical protein
LEQQLKQMSQGLKTVIMAIINISSCRRKKMIMHLICLWEAATTLATRHLLLNSRQLGKHLLTRMLMMISWALDNQQQSKIHLPSRISSQYPCIASLPNSRWTASSHHSNQQTSFKVRIFPLNIPIFNSTMIWMKRKKRGSLRPNRIESYAKERCLKKNRMRHC